MLMLHWALMHPDAEVEAVLYAYGQRHIKELVYAQSLLKMMSSRYSRVIDYIELDLTQVFEQHRSNLLVKSDAADYPGVHEEHLPGRNGVFITAALGLAESRGLDEIWIGCDYSDRVNLFPDCYQEWIYKMNEIAKINGSRPLVIKAPLLGFHKEDVIDMLKALDYDMDKIYSGYAEPGQ